jgi:S-formylglutathione hydrolase
VVDDLRVAVEQHFPIRNDRRGIMGHSMGGHGALTIGLQSPDLYASVSAIAPIVAPCEVPWGQKALSRYLGEDRSTWQRYDACGLLAAGRRHPAQILVDQGTTDKFLQRELQPERLSAACVAAHQSLQLRMHDGYDHSYYFIQSVVDEHLRFHAKHLLN